MNPSCPNVRTVGVCHDQDCSYRHNIRPCFLCGVICDPAANYDPHIRGRLHQARVNGTSNVAYNCSLCHRIVPAVRWNKHLSSAMHIRIAAQQRVSANVAPEEAEPPRDHRHCAICDRTIPSGVWASHIRGGPHLKMEQRAAYRAAFSEAEKDKNGVTVSHEDGLDFGVVDPDDAEDGVLLNLTVKNTVPSSRIEIAELRLSSSASGARTSFRLGSQVSRSSVVFGRDLKILVWFIQENIGRYDDRVEIIFEDIHLRQRFAIVRNLKAICGNKQEYEQLKPRAPYVPRQRIDRDPETNIVPGIPPPAVTTTKWAVPLPFADIPTSLSYILLQGSMREVIARVRATLLPRVLNSQSYARHFKSLLWIEEFRMTHDLEMYDMHDANLSRHAFRYDAGNSRTGRSDIRSGTVYHLDVPGLAENRPSVIVGDRILVQRHGSERGHWFEGHVHFVRLLSVGLKFHELFRGHSDAHKYNVRFKLNRLPLRRQHQALDTAFHSDRILFPTGEHIQSSRAPVEAFRRSLYNNTIGQNPAQLQAVASIAQLTPGTVPFIVFGPPGTGKTVTIVEAIRQVLRVDPNARILACAPSNSAADLIASRLLGLDTATLFRLYAASRAKDKVPSDLLPYTYRNTEHDCFTVPPVNILRRYKVIVSTCLSASLIPGVGVARGHYSHIFIDEAGQATEPEAMISIKMLCDHSTNVILSGDHKQLGPIIRSSVARNFGFETSYMERLMDRPIYDEVVGHGRTVVKLVKNFRSHPDILHFPNTRFYRSGLEPCGRHDVTHTYVGWPQLPNPKFPIIFHAMSGEDQREASSPSFFNILEIQQVKRYVEILRSDRRIRITDKDIGIVTPYQAQCAKMRRSLKMYEDIKVGSVEEFQGQERRVMMISTVRSSREFVEHDLKHTLGFVANPRRFNVAVTRAQALLIVVGDPSVLSLDPLWRSFMNYVYNKGGWRGDEPDWNTGITVNESGNYEEALRDAALMNMNDFTRRMAAVTLQEVHTGTIEVDEAEANFDRPWREED